MVELGQKLLRCPFFHQVRLTLVKKKKKKNDQENGKCTRILHLRVFNKDNSN